MNTLKSEYRRALTCMAVMAATMYCASGISSKEAAAEARGGLIGSCIPAPADTQSWDCFATLSFINCAVGVSATYDPAWQSVGDAEQAKQALSARYIESGNLHAFVDWLACQGFRVVVAGYQQTLHVGEGEIGVSVSYRQVESAPFPVPWYRFPRPYGGRFTIIFSRSGRIVTLQHDYLIL